MTDIERLVFISNGRPMRLTLPENEQIIAFIDAPQQDCSDVNTCLARHLEEVEKQIRALSLLQSELRRLRNSCTVPRASSGCGVLAALYDK